MIQSGRITFGDWTDSNPIGICEGDWNQEGNDRDYITIAGRNSIRFLGSSNAEKMCLLNSGRLGIGTTAPATSLSNTATRIANADGLTVQLTGIDWVLDGQGYVAALSNTATSDNHVGGLLVEIGATGGTNKILDLESGGVNRVRVLGSGNVGIGETAPLGKLHVRTADSGQSVHASADELVVEGSANAGISILCGNSAEAAIYFSTDGDNNIGSLVYDATSHVMAFTTSAATRMKIDSAGNVIPGADSTQDLGSTSLRWANVYTGDLHLSNTNGNDTDGTTGDWTIQEGEDNLYVKNNKSGKTYKFALEEIT